MENNNLYPEQSTDNGRYAQQYAPDYTQQQSYS